MDERDDDRRRVSGLFIAGATALISGVSVFVNSYGVHDFSSPALYTTAKNLVAAIVLGLGTLVAAVIRGDSLRAPRFTRHPRTTRRMLPWRIAGVCYVGIVGGGVAFILFFDGLARTAAAPAAFLHDTLVIFVALLAWPLLHERISVYNVGAIGLLVAGELSISGGIGHLVLGSGALLILGATLLWAIETVIVKQLLISTPTGRIALARMGIGAFVLVGYLAMTGHLGDLGSLDRAQIGWVLITGLLLAAYVATWFTALARAGAIDVTSILVGSVAVTSLLQGFAGHPISSPTYVGVALVALGISAFVFLGRKRVPA